jgi:hypothetical protein
MKKYKLIKEYPKSPKLGCYIEIDDSDNGFVELTSNEYVKLSDYPDYWQEIKEPLFITEDGINVYDVNEILFKIILEDTTNISWINVSLLKSQIYQTDKVFSTKEAAEKWIKENKPRFSEKQVLGALQKGFYKAKIWAEFVPSFKKELGL